MRQAWLGALVLSALVFTACGGSSGQTVAFESAELQGLVTEIDGQTFDLSAVEVRIIETGETVFTAVDGSFEFTGLQPGSYTLAFDTSLNAAAQNARLTALAQREEGEGEGEREGEREEEEDGERDEEREEEEEREDENDFPIFEVSRECGVVTLLVKLENGKVKEYTLDEHETRTAQSKLFAAEGARLDVGGRMTLTAKNGREVFKVDAEVFDPGTVLEFFLDLRDGEGPVSIGTAIADGGRDVVYLRDTGASQSLPRNVDTLDQLAGARLEVRIMAADLTVLIGEVPDLPEEAEHDCERDGEKEEREEEEDGKEEDDEEESDKEESDEDEDESDEDEDEDESDEDEDESDEDEDESDEDEDESDEDEDESDEDEDESDEDEDESDEDSDEEEGDEK